MLFSKWNSLDFPGQLQGSVASKANIAFANPSTPFAASRWMHSMRVRRCTSWCGCITRRRPAQCGFVEVPNLNLFTYSHTRVNIALVSAAVAYGLLRNAILSNDIVAAAARKLML